MDLNKPEKLEQGVVLVRAVGYTDGKRVILILEMPTGRARSLAGSSRKSHASSRTLAETD